MNQPLNKLLQVLHDMNPVSADKLRSTIESQATRLTWMLHGVSAMLFFVLCSFALCVYLEVPLPAGSLFFAQVTGLASMIFALAGLISDAIPLILFLVNFRNEALRNFQSEVQHDLIHVAELLQHDADVLERIRQLINLKMERIKGRLGIFLGGSDKVTLFALATMGWSAWKEFSIVSGDWKQDIFLAGVAFLGGISLGGALLNVILQRYIYHRDLLDLALDHKRKGHALPRFHTVPRPTYKILLIMRWKKVLRFGGHRSPLRDPS